jgi:hypothetical protein
VNKTSSLAAEIVFLMTLFALAVLFRALLSFSSPFYVPGDPTAFFPAEAGMQYRWAATFAEKGTLEARDFHAQWPEGLRFSTDILPTMELVAGWLWRWAKGYFPDFFSFALFFVAFVSSLPILLVYWAARGLGARWGGAFCGAFGAAFQPSALERVVRNFGRENFALVFVLCPIVCLWALLRLNRRCGLSSSRNARLFAVVLLSASVVSQGIAFASWHMSRALFELQAGVFVFAAVVGFFPSPGAQRLVGLWFLAHLPLFFVIDPLVERRYWFSPQIVAMVVLAWGAMVAEKRTARMLAVLVAAGAWGAAHFLRLAPVHDSHVSEVIVAKILHLLVKPADPRALSPEARLMWIEAFNSPSLSQALFLWGWLAAGIAALAVAARRRIVARWRRDAAWRSLYLLVGVWTVSFVLIYRLHILLGFGLAVLWAVLVSDAVAASRRRIAVAAGVILVSFLLGAQGAGVLRGVPWLSPAAPSSPTQFVNRYADTKDILTWLRKYTAPTDVILAWFGFSSQIYAYAERPVVVQSKFENPSIRPKLVALARALYGSPDELATYCRKYGVRYVVYEAPMVLNSGKESYRYVAGVTEIPSTSSVAFMHFWPHELDDFELVYQNRGFRVFAFLGGEDAQTSRPRSTYGWYPLYDREWCGIRRTPVLEDTKIQDALARASALELELIVAETLAASGHQSEALRRLHQLLAKEPRFWQAAVLMAKLYARSGNFAAAEKACIAAQVGYPQCPGLPQVCKACVRGEQR